MNPLMSTGSANTPRMESHINAISAIRNSHTLPTCSDIRSLIQANATMNVLFATSSLPPQVRVTIIKEVCMRRKKNLSHTKKAEQAAFTESARKSTEYIISGKKPLHVKCAKRKCLVNMLLKNTRRFMTRVIWHVSGVVKPLKTRTN